MNLESETGGLQEAGLYNAGENYKEDDFVSYFLISGVISLHITYMYSCSYESSCATHHQISLFHSIRCHFSL